MKIKNASINAINLIKEFEGFRNTPYYCPAHIVTCGYGSTHYEDGTKILITDNQISEERAIKMLQHDLINSEQALIKLIKSDINQNQFDALIDFVYNLGVGSLSGSTLLKKVNANPSDVTIGIEFMKWVYADGKQLPGLIKRRDAEVKLYFK